MIAHRERFATQLSDLLPSEDHVLGAILAAPKSSPAPDSLPFAAFQAGPALAARVQHSLRVCLLSTPDAPLPHRFDDCILVVLPKKPIRVTGGREMYSPGNLRPISIINTVNRLLTNTSCSQHHAIAAVSGQRVLIFRFSDH